MKIGRLTPANIAYTRMGGKQSLPPAVDAAVPTWSWKAHHATGIELHLAFEKDVFLAAVSLTLGADSRLESAEVLADGRLLGAHRAETDRDFGGTFTVEVGKQGRAFCLRLIPTMTDTVIEELACFGCEAVPAPLYPSPASYLPREGSLAVSRLAGVRSDGHADCRFAADYLAERLALMVTAGDGFSITQDESLPADAYRLEITPEAAALRASTRLGLLYGIERLFELAQDGFLPCCVIDDAPYKPMRGVHLYLPCRAQIPFFRSLLKNILIPFHYNQIFLEFAGGMRFDSHPEISEGWLEGNRRAKRGEIPPFPHGAVANGELLEKDEVREMCDFARELGFELIPEVQSFGHVQYITYAHPDIAEIDPEQEEDTTDARDADIPPALFYKHSYCPQNPKSYAIIHDLIDEIVEVVRPPRFVHCGHDEIYQLGLCPKCKSVPHDRLYEMHVRDLHDYLAAKGLGMMLWADMVQPVTKYQCYPAMERLPRDIVWLDFVWYFHLDKDIEENLLEKDYRVMMGNLYSSHYPRYESRAAKDGMTGGQVSFWTYTNEQCVAREGKFYDLMYTAEMLWSKDYDHRARLAVAERIAARLPRVRTTLRGESPMTVKTSLNIAKDENMLFFGETKGLLLTKIAGIPVNSKAAGLRFTHTALYREKRIAWGPLVQIGTYTVTYGDGSAVEIPITYDGNVRCCKYRFGEPLKDKYYRHEGYVCAWEADPVEVEPSADGTPMTLYALTWRNPHPEKVIASIRCAEHADSAAGLLLCGIDVMQN